MTKNKDMYFLKITVPTIILFAIYIFLYEMTGNAEGKSDMGLVPLLIGIVTTIVYYFISAKLLKFEYDRVGGFVPQAIVFLTVNYLAMLYYEFTLENDNWFSAALMIGITFLFIYVMGSAIYVMGVCVAQSIKEKRFWEVLKRAVSIIVAYTLYLALILAWQWVKENGDFIYRVPEIFLTIIKYVVLFVATAIFHFINGKLLKISSEKFRDHAILLWSFVCISFVFLFFNEQKYNAEFDLRSAFLLIAFTYVTANLTYYLIKSLWEAFFKRKKKVKDERDFHKQV